MDVYAHLDEEKKQAVDKINAVIRAVLWRAAFSCISLSIFDCVSDYTFDYIFPSDYSLTTLQNTIFIAFQQPVKTQKNSGNLLFYWVSAIFSLVKHGGYQTGFESPIYFVFLLNEARGIRTPDNLIKSQVLYRLS